MASHSVGSCKKVLVLFLVSPLVSCFEFNVGGDDGWIVPKSRGDSDMYNQWASKNRFLMDDTVHFKYGKDSVMVVTEEEYKKCRSTHPIFYSNNGDTTFKLDRPGLFYFISGVTGHCEKGLKLIIKVLDIEAPPPQYGNDSSPSTDDLGKSGAIGGMNHVTSTSRVIVMLVVCLSLLGSVFA